MTRITIWFERFYERYYAPCSFHPLAYTVHTHVKISEKTIILVEGVVTFIFFFFFTPSQLILRFSERSTRERSSFPFFPRMHNIKATMTELKRDTFACVMYACTKWLDPVDGGRAGGRCVPKYE